MSPETLHDIVAPAPATDSILVLDGLNLTIAEVVQVARQRRRVALSGVARRRIQRCRAMVEVLLDKKEKVYGLTTGFGSLRDIAIEEAQVKALQTNLIISHAAGVGRPFAEDAVRAAILLRINTLARGNSGIRPEVIDALIQMLNGDVYPEIPDQGSVGCSGDLAPLSHLGLALIGHGAARIANPATAVDGLRDATAEFVTLDALGDAVPFTPIVLEAKEGLAVNNGTQFMTGIACLTVYDSAQTLRVAELAAAMSLEADAGVLAAYDDRLHAVRPHAWQRRTAQNIAAYCEDSEIIGFYINSARIHRAAVSVELAQRLVDAEGGPPRHAVGKLQSGLARLLKQITRLTTRADDPTADDSIAPPEGVDLRTLSRRFARRSAREQIDAFTAYLAPIRHEASALLQSVQGLMFPRGDHHSQIEAALVSVVTELSAAVRATPRIQDDYSFRCAPQVYGGAFRALAHVASIARVEINSATDNPLLFPPAAPEADLDDGDYRRWLLETYYGPERPHPLVDCVIGGGNFHGQPIATAMDYLAIAMAEIGSISERRVAHLVDAKCSNGLPGFLIDGAGLNSGFMIPQYTAAALVSENKVLCHPASVDSIPTCANAEDHVSMGTIAARKAAKVVDHVRTVVAIEILAARQALGFREPLRPGTRIVQVIACLTAEGLDFITEDVYIAPRIAQVRQLIDRGALDAALLPLGEVIA